MAFRREYSRELGYGIGQKGKETVEKSDHFKCKVIESNPLTPNVFELKFAPDRPLDFKAGQYVSVIVPAVDGKPLRRPYSIASAPGVSPIELCIQKVEKGPGSNYLAGLKPGDTFECVAPYGYLTYHPRPDKHAVFISTGTGIAPFRSMVLSEEFRKSPPLSTLFCLGVRTDHDVLYETDFISHPLLKWIPCLTQSVGRVSEFFKGRVTAFLESQHSQFAWSETEFYLCGNGAMIDDVRKFLKGNGVDRKAIHVEVYFRPEAPPEQAAVK